MYQMISRNIPLLVVMALSSICCSLVLIAAIGIGERIVAGLP